MMMMMNAPLVTSVIGKSIQIKNNYYYNILHLSVNIMMKTSHGFNHVSSIM